LIRQTVCSFSKNDVGKRIKKNITAIYNPHSALNDNDFSILTLLLNQQVSFAILV
jgi:hypothetical protein